MCVASNIACDASTNAGDTAAGPATRAVEYSQGCHACGRSKFDLGVRHMKVCSVCRIARYCGRQCQLSNGEDHKIHCDLYVYAIGMALDNLTTDNPTLVAGGAIVEIWHPAPHQDTTP